VATIIVGEGDGGRSVNAALELTGDGLGLVCLERPGCAVIIVNGASITSSLIDDMAVEDSRSLMLCTAVPACIVVVVLATGTIAIDAEDGE
jgi:hypothetical protein